MRLKKTDAEIIGHGIIGVTTLLISGWFWWIAEECQPAVFIAGFVSGTFLAMGLYSLLLAWGSIKGAKHEI